MKKGYTHITVILDSSGSMGSIATDTVGGFNTFIDGQKKAEGEATITHIHFSSGAHKGDSRLTRHFVGYLEGATGHGIINRSINNSIWGGPLNLSIPRNTSDSYAVVEDFVNVKEAKELVSSRDVYEVNKKIVFSPYGNTPLLDSIGRAIFETGERLSKLGEDERPEKVLFVIITDGEENASIEYSRDDIAKIIDHQKNTYKWEFMYLGANQDAITVAKAINIDGSKAMSYGLSTAEIDATYNTMSTKLASYRSAGAAATVLDFNDIERKSAKVDN